MRKSIAKNIKNIKSHRIYSTKELAQELGAHPRTIQTYQKQGLVTIDPDCKPFLFRGCDAKDFLLERRDARKQGLKDNEFYCTKCRKPMKSLDNSISWDHMGSNGRIHIKGICYKCGTVINRFGNIKSIKEGVFGETARKAYIRLNVNHPANVNTDLGKGNSDE